VSSSNQTGSSSPSSRSTGFVPADEAISPEVRAFGGLFIVLWLLLLAFMFVTRRRQRALRGEVERLEALFDARTSDATSSGARP
jgi:hypothetical protein